MRTGQIVLTFNTPAFCMLALCLAAAPAGAQDVANPLLTFRYSSSLNLSDNYDLQPDSPGNSTLWDNSLDVGYRSETETQSFALSGGATLRFADLPDRDYDPAIDNPRLRLDYALTGVDTRLSARASYSRADIAFFDPLYDMNDRIDPVTGADLLDGGGRRESYAGTLSLETGLASPFGFNLSLTSRGRSYSGTTDPRYYDNHTNALNAGMRMVISPVTMLSFTGSFTTYTADDVEETDRVSKSISAGIGQEISSVLRLDASLGYRRIETEETLRGLRGTTTDDGVTASVGLQRELANGNAGISLSHDITTDGGRSTLSVSRLLILPEGELNLSAGVTKGEGDPGLVGSLSYAYPVWSGEISTFFSHTIGSNFDGEEETRSRAGLGLTQALTPLTDARLRIDYLDISNDTDGDLRRMRLTASLSYDLTRDWEIASGYEYTRLHDDPKDVAVENSIFLRIERQFQFRP